MSIKQMSKMALRAGKCLQKSVQEEYEKKALLGQYVIISQNGKPCRISAKEALKIAKSK